MDVYEEEVEKKQEEKEEEQEEEKEKEQEKKSQLQQTVYVCTFLGGVLAPEYMCVEPRRQPFHSLHRGIAEK